MWPCGTGPAEDGGYDGADYRFGAGHIAGEFCRNALELAEREGLIVADNTTRNPIIYLQVAEGCHPGVHLAKGSDLQAPREVPSDLATVDSWWLRDGGCSSSAQFASARWRRN